MAFALCREELAWAAGFFDGEGYVGAIRRDCPQGINTRLLLSIAQTCPDPLMRFRAAVGNAGNVTGPYKRTNTPTRKMMWSFSASSFEDVQAITAFLWFWLSAPKQAQVVRALQNMRASCFLQEAK